MTEIVMSDEKKETELKTDEQFELWRQLMLTSYTSSLRMYSWWLWMYPDMRTTLLNLADDLEKEK